MIGYNERVSVGGGQHAPSLSEVESWQDYADARESEIIADAIAGGGDYPELDALYNQCVTTGDLKDFYFAVREKAEGRAYDKFGFNREHMV